MVKPKILTKIKAKYIYGLDMGASKPKKWVLGVVALRSDAIILGHSGIAFPSIDNVGQQVPKQITKGVKNYLSLSHTDKGKKIMTIITSHPKHLAKLERNILLLMLHSKPVIVKHPALVGGAINDTSTWDEGRLAFLKDKKSGSEKIVIIKDSKDNASVLLDTIESVELEQRQVKKNVQSVMNIKHRANNETYTSYLTANNKILTALMRYLKNHLESMGLVPKSNSLMSAEWSDKDLKVSDMEEQILVALYSEISSLEINTMLEMDVNELEKIYERLIKLGLLSLVRVRQEVELSTKGRTIVNQKMKVKDEVEKPLY